VSLAGWYKLAKKAKWRTLAEVRQDCGSADQVKKFVVFNIGGNKYRLITVIHYNRQKLFIRHVLTHGEYDEEGWKHD
jgi:mRNA interferase HigB